MSRTVSKGFRLFNVTVVVTARAGDRNLQGTNTVHVVLIPRNSGNGFVESSIKVVNQSKASKPTGNNRDRGMSVKGFREFSLHRLFRRPSLQVKKISSSDLRFSQIINEIKRKVVQKALGQYPLCCIVCTAISKKVDICNSQYKSEVIMAWDVI